MTSGQVFTSRLRNRPLLDEEETPIGRIRDVVILPAARGEAPRALGLIVTLQRRRIFVNFGRIAEISVDGAHLRGGTVDLGRFIRRTGEILASELYGKPVDGGIVVDVAIAPADSRRDGWEVPGRRAGRAARRPARAAPHRPGQRGGGDDAGPAEPDRRGAAGRRAG
jgi:hypothetical protein